MVVLVTGSSGQVGQAIQYIAPNYPQITFHFADSIEGDITDPVKLQLLFGRVKPNYCINTAAYTAVDKAESEPEKAELINATGVRILAETCREFSCTLVHLSTDFVFDGTKTTPYTEEDIPNPQSVYGLTKLSGELAIQETLTNYFIVRTSWVYSQFGNNFMKTMLRLAAERDSISVVNDQIGSPTHAVDLAEVLITIILSGSTDFGIYHYSNGGACSWYEFAQKIFEIHKIEIDLRPILTSEYPTAAKRPGYSVMDGSKIILYFNCTIQLWANSLHHYNK